MDQNSNDFASMSCGPIQRVARVYSNANSKTGNAHGRWVVIVILDSDSKVVHEFTEPQVALAEYYRLVDQLAVMHSPEGNRAKGLAYVGHAGLDTPGAAPGGDA